MARSDKQDWEGVDETDSTTESSSCFCKPIDSIESTGAYKPQELLPEAIKIMLDKLDSVEHCMRVKFPGLVPASKEMQVDPEEAFANEGRVPKGRGAGRKARK
jgi:hypothetical protein